MSRIQSTPKAGKLRRRKVSRGADSRGTSLSRMLGWVVLTVVIAVGGALTMSVCEGRVLTGRTGAAPQRMELTISPKPDWMPDALADHISTSLLPRGVSYYSKDLTDRVWARAIPNAWVRRVHRVSKHLNPDAGRAIVEVQAEFRMPVAMVKCESIYAYLDEEGYRLPASQVPQWAAWRRGDPDNREYYLARELVPADMVVSRIHYMVVEGARHKPPGVGDRWTGDDIAAGLDLVKLVAPKPYAYQITEIDVRNFVGRIDPDQPHLRMWAQFGRSNPTDIRFGRFPRPDGDYVVSPERKLSYLDQYAQDHGGSLAGADRHIDLRYDQLHVSIN